MNVKILKALVPAVIVIVIGCGQTAAQGKPCGCADKKDLLRLLNRAHMSIQELEFKLGQLNAQEQALGKPELFTGEGYEELRETVRRALKDLNESGTSYDLLKPDAGDCAFSEPESSGECQRQVFKSLFDVYRQACSETRDLPLDQNPYRLMRQVIRHEISAFRAMQDFILKMLAALPKDCRPNGWFGYIVYRRVKSVTINKAFPPDTNIPRPDAGISITTGGNEITQRIGEYAGTIYVEDSKPVGARGYAKLSLDQTKTATGRVYCSPRKPDVTLVVTGGRKDFADGEREAPADFGLSVYEQSKKYHMYLAFFPVYVKGTMDTHSETSGGCGGKPAKFSNALSTRLEGDKYNFDVEMPNGAGDYLSGSQSEKPPEMQTTSQSDNITIVQTFEITTRWMFRRLPRQK